MIVPYVVRDHAWNFPLHDNTNFEDYKHDSPYGYREDLDFEDPNPTNAPLRKDPEEEFKDC
jgi:hypothetical protein